MEFSCKYGKRADCFFANNVILYDYKNLKRKGPNMKRRILAFVIAAVMITAIIPLTVSAAEKYPGYTFSIEMETSYGFEMYPLGTGTVTGKITEPHEFYGGVELFKTYIVPWQTDSTITHKSLAVFVVDDGVQSLTVENTYSFAFNPEFKSGREEQISVDYIQYEQNWYFPEHHYPDLGKILLLGPDYGNEGKERDFQLPVGAFSLMYNQVVTEDSEHDVIGNMSGNPLFYHFFASIVFTKSQAAAFLANGTLPADITIVKDFIDLDELKTLLLDEKEPSDPRLAGAAQWAIDQGLGSALEAGLIPDAFIGKWTSNTDRLLGAETMVKLIEKITGKTMAAIAEEKGFDLTDTFTDTSDPYATFLKASGISRGVGEGAYGTTGSFTRIEIVTMLGRMAEYIFDVDMSGYPPGSDTFRDLPSWARNDRHVSWASATEVVRGTGVGLFSPLEPLPNQQTGLFLLRAFNELGK